MQTYETILQHPAAATYMASHRALDYLRYHEGAPVTPAERAYALKSNHGAATRGRVNELLAAVLIGRVEGIHLESAGWLDAAHRLLQAELASAQANGLISATKQAATLRKMHGLYTPEGLLELLLSTHYGIAKLRTARVLAQVSTADKFFNHAA